MKKTLALLFFFVLVVGFNNAYAAPYTWAQTVTIDQVEYYDNGSTQRFTVRTIRTSDSAVVWFTADSSDLTRVNRLLALLLTAKTAGSEVYPCMESTTGRLIGLKIK